MSSRDRRRPLDANVCWELSRFNSLRMMHPDIWAFLDGFCEIRRGKMGLIGYVQHFLRISSARQEIINVLADCQRSLTSPFIGDWRFIRRTSRSRRILIQQLPIPKKIKTSMSLLRLRDLTWPDRSRHPPAVCTSRRLPPLNPQEFTNDCKRLREDDSSSLSAVMGRSGMLGVQRSQGPCYTHT
jgi:hypothetical protein